MNETLILTAKTGRPCSIPRSAYGLVFQRHEAGQGYRRIASLLAGMRVCYSTKSSVHRLIAGLPPYRVPDGS